MEKPKWFKIAEFIQIDWKKKKLNKIRRGWNMSTGKFRCPIEFAPPARSLISLILPEVGAHDVCGTMAGSFAHNGRHFHAKPMPNIDTMPTQVGSFFLIFFLPDLGNKVVNVITVIDLSKLVGTLFPYQSRPSAATLSSVYLPTTHRASILSNLR